MHAALYKKTKFGGTDTKAMGQTEPQFLSDPMSDRKKSFRQLCYNEYFKSLTNHLLIDLDLTTLLLNLFDVWQQSFSVTLLTILSYVPLMLMKYLVAVQQLVPFQLCLAVKQI